MNSFRFQRASKLVLQQRAWSGCRSCRGGGVTTPASTSRFWALQAAADARIRMSSGGAPARAFSGVRFFSSSSSSGGDVDKKRDSSIIARTLYRQLLQWCRRTDPALPLQFFLPRVQLTAPSEVDAERLEILEQLYSENKSSSDDEKLNGSDVSDNEVSMMIQQRILPLLPPRSSHRTRFYASSSNGSAEGDGIQPQTTRTLQVTIQSATDLMDLMRAVFRLNASEPLVAAYQTERITAAFETLRQLNELSNGTLEELVATRQRSLDELQQQQQDPSFLQVGQVVQHRHERWRGVVVGWEDNETTTFATDQKTSLTTKDYVAAGVENDDDISRTRSVQVLVDAGDVMLLSGTTGRDRAAIGSSADHPYSLTSTTTTAPELSLVEDVDLTRIRNPQMSEYFQRFDARTHRFVPNALLAYKYPTTQQQQQSSCSEHDNESEADADKSAATQHRQQVGQNVLSGVQTFCRHLHDMIDDEMGKASDGSSDSQDLPLLLSHVQSRLSQLASPATSDNDDGNTGNSTVALMEQHLHRSLRNDTVALAASYLHDWLLLTLEVLDVVWQRRTCQEHLSKIQFRVGDVVRHKLYNFRGVIVAWDPKPTIDVTRWDGLQDIDNPMELPFYHVVPDPHDCIQAFGGVRPFRYVCQENLEHCALDETDIDVDIDDPEWSRESVEGRGYRYVPPSYLLFKYAQEEEGSDPAGVSERCMARLQREINAWQFQAASNSLPDDSPASQLSASNLTSLLQLCDTSNDASSIQETLKEIRKAHRRDDLRWRLDTGVSELVAGKAQNALDIFSAIVADDPDYFEAWNKRATCEFMLGEYEQSLQSTQKALELDTTHVPALTGMGLVHFEMKDYEKASEYFRKSIQLDPWSPASSKLSACVDFLDQLSADDDLAK